MARPKRKRLEFDTDSVNKLLQEIYDESHNIKAKISRLFTKWELKIKENGDIAAIGDQIVKLIAAEAKNQDQKIMLLKYLKEVVFDKKDNDDKSVGNDDNRSIDSNRRSELIRMVSDDLERRGKL